ncbi:hypothetical protein Scep_023882 [Stephania cephalantha]|uniref:Uncharacterized protein n=1 Tax=Stephania cephalantha TaxID=152367 RepID=A0AAP0HWN0_9MAGN
MKFEGLHTVKGEGMGGGLALFWKHSDQVSILSSSPNFIDALVSIPGVPRYRLTGFYGYLNAARRRASWDLLSNLSKHSEIPWCVLDDFNDILHWSEKEDLVVNRDGALMALRRLSKVVICLIWGWRAILSLGSDTKALNIGLRRGLTVYWQRLLGNSSSPVFEFAIS